MVYTVGRLAMLNLTIPSILFLLSSCSGPSYKNDKTLLIAVAASVAHPMEEIAAEFESKHHISCILIPGSSGKLSAQIEQGAPFDVFVSADEDYPRKLLEKGLAVDSPQVYARGFLALWSGKQDTIPAWHDLTTSKIQTIAMANPKTAPYGRAAQEALINLGIFDSVREKLVFGESIGQTNQFIFSGSVDIGITSLSTLYAIEPGNRKFWMALPDSSYTPLIQSAVVLSGSGKSKQLAKQFLTHLSHPSSQRILEKYGYGIPSK